MERYFYGPAVFEHEVEYEGEWGKERAWARLDGYAVWDRKLGHDEDKRLCWAVDTDHAQKIVDALNKADAS